jgi:hypothetical protein
VNTHYGAAIDLRLLFEKGLHIALRIANYMKTTPLNTRMFAVLYEVMYPEDAFFKHIFSVNEDRCFGGMF